MSTLTIVRHGQASFFDENYDKLSPVGEKQAEALGEYWARSQVRFHHAFAGPRERHQRTAEIAASTCRSRGVSFPEPAVLPEFDEYRADEVMRLYLPALARQDAEIRPLYEESQRTKGTPDAPRAIEFLFRAVTTKWVRGEFEAGEAESFELFCRRVGGALEDVRNHGTKSANVVVFTSAGPTAVAMKAALGLSPLATLELSWLVRNCACSEFLFSGGRFSLLSFNAVPHLTQPELVTYR